MHVKEDELSEINKSTEGRNFTDDNAATYLIGSTLAKLLKDVNCTLFKL